MIVKVLNNWLSRKEDEIEGDFWNLRSSSEEDIAILEELNHELSIEYDNLDIEVFSSLYDVVINKAIKVAFSLKNCYLDRGEEDKVYDSLNDVAMSLTFYQD